MLDQHRTNEKLTTWGLSGIDRRLPAAALENRHIIAARAIVGTFLSIGVPKVETRDPLVTQMLVNEANPDRGVGVVGQRKWGQEVGENESEAGHFSREAWGGEYYINMPYI